MDSLLNNTTELLSKLLLTQEQLLFLPESYFKYFQFILVPLLALAIALLLTPLIGYFAKKHGIIDIPGKGRSTRLNKYDNPERHSHKKATPTLGGLAVLLPFLIITPFLIDMTPSLIAFFVAVGLLTLTGVLDDIYNLPATFQMIMHLLASVIVALFVVDLASVTIPLLGFIDLECLTFSSTILTVTISLVFPGDLLIIPWIILCINAMKWVSGSDGLLETNMIIALTLISIVAFRSFNGALVVISLFLTGAISGFLYFNFPPAKIFSLSTGKTVYGFLIATLALLNTTKVATTIIIIALPLVDATFVLLKRYFTYKPKNLIDLMRINGKDHLHHQLIKLNFSPRRILMVEASIALLFGILALFSAGALRMVLLLGSLLLTMLLILFINIRASVNKKEQGEQKKESPESKYSY